MNSPGGGITGSGGIEALWFGLRGFPFPLQYNWSHDTVK
jgi:hypothetical protein